MNKKKSFPPIGGNREINFRQTEKISAKTEGLAKKKPCFHLNVLA